MHEIDRRLAPTFASQLSLITRAQALAAGADDATIRRRVLADRWERAERGVYGLVGVHWSWRRHLAAVVLSLPQSMASHRAGASLLGVHWDDRATPPIELSIPRGAAPERRFDDRAAAADVPVVIHEQKDLGRAGRIIVDGIPTTPPLRLAVDLGAVVDFDRYRRAVSQLVRHHGVGWNELDRVYRRHSIQGRDGCGALRDVLHRHFETNGAPDEVVEARCADLLLRAGLPAPMHQYEVVLLDGSRVRLDLAYPDLRIGIETDGGIHGDDDVRERDNARRNQLHLLGWTMFHFTWEDVVHRPDLVVATVEAALQAAHARTSAPASGRI